MSRTLVPKQRSAGRRSGWYESFAPCIILLYSTAYAGYLVVETKGGALLAAHPCMGLKKGLHGLQKADKGASVLTCMCKDVSLSSASMHSFCAGAGNSNN